MAELDKMQVENDKRLIGLLVNAGLASFASKIQDAMTLAATSRELRDRSPEHAAAHARRSDSLESLRRLAVDTLYDLSRTRVSHSRDKVRVHLHGEFAPRRLAEILTEIQGHATAVKLQQGLLCERHPIEAVS